MPYHFVVFVVWILYCVFFHYISKSKPKADAVITNQKNLPLGILTADCVPILLYDYVNNIIGCIHAGWKGAYSGIIENTIIKMNKINSNLKH